MRLNVSTCHSFCRDTCQEVTRSGTGLGAAASEDWNRRRRAERRGKNGRGLSTEGERHGAGTAGRLDGQASQKSSQEEAGGSREGAGSPRGPSGSEGRVSGKARKEVFLLPSKMV